MRTATEIERDEALARVQELERRRDNWRASTDAERARAERAEAEVQRLREALEACGDYAFGTWEFDKERREAGTKAEALARAALSEEPR